MTQIRITEFDKTQFDSSARLLLSECEVHIWWACTQAFLFRCKDLEMLLSREELRRMERYYFKQDRIRFVVAHGLLRVIIGRYLDISPHHVEFRSGPNGKPELHAHFGSEPFSFNISHSHTMVAFAFTKYRNIGVDVEHIRPVPEFNEVLNHSFHPNERYALQTLPLFKREIAFLECWTQKEAFLKATGEGLSRSLDSFFIATGSKKGEDVFNVNGDGIRTANWSVVAFRPMQNYSGAVAYET